MLNILSILHSSEGARDRWREGERERGRERVWVTEGEREDCRNTESIMLSFCSVLRERERERGRERERERKRERGKERLSSCRMSKCSPQKTSFCPGAYSKISPEAISSTISFLPVLLRTSSISSRK